MKRCAVCGKVTENAIFDNEDKGYCEDCSLNEIEEIIQNKKGGKIMKKRCSFCLDEVSINEEYRVGEYLVCEDCYETFYACDICGAIVDARFTEIYENMEMCIDCYKKIRESRNEEIENN